MKDRFKKYERAAGLFVLTAFLGAGASFLSIAVKKGWFDSKVPFYTILDTAEGVRVGTTVEMAGVPVGSVDAVGFDESQNIRVTLSIYERHVGRVRADSKIQVIRPYVIGEKSLYLTMGTKDGPLAKAGGLLKAEEVVGLTEVLNGQKLIPYMETLNGAVAGMKDLVDLLLKTDGKGSENFVKALTGLYPLLVEVKKMSEEVTKLSQQVGRGDQLGKVVKNLAAFTDELNSLSPHLSATMPAMSKDISAIVSNLAVLTDPKSSKRIVEAIDNAVIVLKAMQRSFLLSGSSREVKEEEAKQLEIELQKARSPASEEPKGHRPERRD